MSIISIFQIITLKIINIASCQRIIITFTARPWTHLLLVHYLRSLVVDSITIIFFDSFDSMLLPSWGSSQLFSSEVYTIILLSPPPFITTRRLDVLNYDNVRASLYFSTLKAHSKLITRWGRTCSVASSDSTRENCQYCILKARS